MSYMVDIFNRLGRPGGLNATLPAPTPAPVETAAPQQAMSGLMSNFAPPAPQTPNPQGAMNGLMSNFPQPAPQSELGQIMSVDLTPKEQFLAVCGIPPRREDMSGGNGQIGFRTANGDTGLQGANMPQPQRSSWLDGLLPPSGNAVAGGVGSGGFDSQPMSYGMFGGGAPQQGGPMQMPSAPFQAGMRAGSVGNQMGGLNNMYSNFAAPSPMPAPPPPMFGAPAGNSRAMMGPRPVGIF